MSDTKPCPDLGKDGHNHPANPCPKCGGTGTTAAPEPAPCLEVFETNGDGTGKKQLCRCGLSKGHDGGHAWRGDLPGGPIEEATAAPEPVAISETELTMWLDELEEELIDAIAENCPYKQYSARVRLEVVRGINER